MSRVNPFLLRFARERTKQAFIPSDAAAGGPPGGAPAAGGGGAPGGPAPGSPAPGGPPPAGGAGPAASPPPSNPSEIDAKVQQAVQTAMQTMGGGAGGPGGAPGAMGKPAKPDINTVAMDIFQVKKMLSHVMRHQGIELPTDVLDGPNRHPSMGHPVPPGTPGSTSDPAGNGSGGGAGPQGPGAIPPIEPIQPAAMGGKTASAFTPAALVKEAAELLSLYAQYLEAGVEVEKVASVGEYNTPGRPIPREAIPASPAQSVVTKAAAVARLFNVRKP